MPYADNNGVKINYEVEGEGTPLVLQHGFSSSLQSWRDNGYVDALKSDYKLIMIDSRGHGASDKPHDPESYDMKIRVGDILAVMDAEGIDKAHYWGYSMGGQIGFELVFAHQKLEQPTHSRVVAGRGLRATGVAEAAEGIAAEVPSRLDLALVVAAVGTCEKGAVGTQVGAQKGVITGGMR